MKIYIVYGMTGEYADAREWSVKAFRLKKNATALAKKLNKVSGGRERISFSRTDSLKEKLVKAGDPGASVDYTGTEYGVYPLELDE